MADQKEPTVEDRTNAIDANKKLTAEEKQILKLYDQGMQTYAIAKEVYKFVNNDTVGAVILAIRKEHADDFSEVENVNSTKGYSGIGS